MSAATIVVAGALANKPANGGEAWVRLNWIRGLERLGCDVWFIEQIDASHCTDSRGRPAPFAASANVAWFRDVTRRFGLADRAWLLCDNGEAIGPPLDLAHDVAADALLVNISGHLRQPSLMAAFARRAYVDIDPGFTQIWHAQGTGGARLDGHDVYFTIGANIGRPGCSIPACGIGWHHVCPPIVLDDWPCCEWQPSTDTFFSTVATWRGPFGPIEFDRRRFGLKVHQFRKFIAVPQLVGAPFEAALNIHPAEVADLELLADNGWRLVEPAHAAGTPEAFRDYIVSSAAEFSVAQGVYVDTGSGWFSDRTTAYLASGRPALVQDTGFGRNLPTGKGLVSFSTLSEAASGASSIIDHYEVHAAAARQIAETYFDSDTVLARVLEQCEVAG